MGVDDLTYGLYSPTAAAEGSELDQLITDTTVSLIFGLASLDTYDQFVSEWRNRGGDQIRQEFQEALQKREG